MHSGNITSDTGLITFRISSNGKEIASSIDVMALNIDLYLLSRDMAVITLNDGSVDNAFSISESKTFAPGALIELSLGYNNDLESIYKGVVSKQIIEVDPSVGSILKVICQTFNPLGRKPVKPVITLAGLSDPELIITYGDNLLGLEMELNTKHQGSLLTKYRGAVSFQGTAIVKVNSLIRLNGLGKRFSGDVYVSGVSHDVSEGHWITTAYIGISSRKLEKYKAKKT